MFKRVSLIIFYAKKNLDFNPFCMVKRFMQSFINIQINLPRGKNEVTKMMSSILYLALPALQYVDVLLITLLCLIPSAVAGIILPRLGKDWCALRRVPGLDVLDESVKICAEKGRPLFQSTGGLGTTGYTIEHVESLLMITRYLTKRCGELGVRYISVSNNAQLQLLILDFAKQGYQEAGHPEMFSSRDVRYTAGGATQLIMEHVDTMRYNKPGAFIGLGTWGSGTPVPVFQEAVNVGAFSIGSARAPDELAQAASSSDYSLQTEEMVVAGAYIENDPEKMSVFVGEDVAKLGLIVICIVIGILNLAGWNIKFG